MNNVRVRLPRKLAKSVSGGMLAEEGRLNPVGPLGITLNMLPLHRVTMTLSEKDLPLGMHDLVEVYNHKGSVGIYRVTKIPHNIGKNRKYELSHGLDVFSDATFDMLEEYKGTVAGMLAKIVNAQTQTIGGTKYWQLGTCADPNPWNKDIKYDNLMECLTEIARKEEDYMFTFDQSTFPWTLNFVARNSDVLSEFRLNRNTENCVITEDDADLCTRLYLSVTSETNDDEGHGTYIDEGYFTYNDTTAQADFGIVCKTAGVNQEDFASQAALEAWVAAYFGRHNKPGVQITIDGVELNKLTGESIDEVHLARICRVALPEYSCTFNERIVSVNYPDALRKPTYVRNSLANKRQTAEDAFSEIKKTASSASKSAGGAGRAAHNDATYFRRTIGDTANGLYSRIEQTAYYIRAEVVDVANGLYSRIEETASYIRAEVANTANGLYSRIEETASYIRSEVANTACNIRSEITQTASEWSAKISGVVDSSGNVTIASIVAGVNAQDGSFVKISAGKIDLSGYVTMTDFNSTKGHVDNLTGGTVVEDFCKAKLLVGTTVTATNTFTHDGDTIYKRNMLWTSGGGAIATVHATGDTSSIILNHSHAMSVDSSGNVTVGDAQTTTGTFNIADTAFYKARVASAWNSGGATAKADQQSQHAPYGGSVVIKIQYVNNEGTTVDTGRSVTIWNTACSHTFDDNRTFTTNGTYYSSTYGYSGFSKVIVDVNTATEEKTITSNGTYTPSSGKIGFSKVVVSVSCGHTFGERTFSSNGTYYPSTYGYSGFSKVIVDVNCGHTFGTKSISSNGTFYASSDGYSGFSSVTVSGVRTTKHSNSVDNLTKAGTYNVLYAVDSSGITLSVKVKNISSSGRVWYYRSSSMDPTNMYT